MVIAAVTNTTVYTSIGNALRVITPANVSNPIEFWLAFLLILAILNTVLKRVHFFSEKQNNGARAITALIIAYFAVTAAWVSPILLYMSSTLAITAIVLVSILIVSAMAGYEIKGKATSVLFIVAIIILLFSGLFSYVFVPSSLVGVKGTGSAITGVLSTFFSNPSNIGIVIVLVFFLVVIPIAIFGVGGKSQRPKSP